MEDTRAFLLIGFPVELFDECRVVRYFIFRLTNISSIQEQPIDEPPASPIRVDSRDTRYGRAIVITQGILPSVRSPSSQTKPTQFDYESVAQNLKAIDQTRQQQQLKDVDKGDEFERWQKQQREIAEQRERELEENREERESLELRELREREQREREQRERELREQREREQREREQLERELREQRERDLREQHEREQREREQRERELREQRERDLREQREQREREQREREQREQLEREQERERQERERKEREELEHQERLERERMERERLEFVERQKKEQEEREKAERQQLELQKHREERQAFDSEQDKTRLLARERKMLYPGEKGSKETLDYIEAMSADEVEREFQRRLEVEKKRRNLDDNVDRRSGGLVSVTRVTYHHPDRNDQAERDRKLQMIIQERRLVERQRKEADRRNVFEGERAQQRDAQRRQHEEREREQEDWLKQQKEKHEQSRREQSRILQDRKAQEDQDVSKIRSELKQRREQEEIIRKNLQRLREDEEKKITADHQQERLNQEQELQRKLEEQSILREKETEARKQLQEEQRLRSARGSSSEPDHVMELKERALRDYERRRALIDQEINRQQAESRYQEQQRQKELDEVKEKFDQQRPVSVLKTSNGTKPKKQVSFSNMSTEIREPASPTYVVESSSGYAAKITPAASVRLVQTRPPADHDAPPIPRPPPPDDDDDFDPPPLPPPPPPEELDDEDYFPPPPPSSTNSSDPRHPMDTNSRNYSNVFPADYPFPPNKAQYRNTSVGSGFGTFPRAARPMSYPTPADLDSIQLNDTGLKYSGSNNNISGYNMVVSGLRETQSLGRISTSGEVEANRMRMARISLSDESRDKPPPIPKKPEHLAFKEKMKMFNQDGTPKNRATVSRWQRGQLDVNGDVSYT